MNEKNPVGRPPLPKHLLKKRTTKIIRVPLDIADELKAIANAYDDKSLSSADIQAFIDGLKDKEA